MLKEGKRLKDTLECVKDELDIVKDGLKLDNRLPESVRNNNTYANQLKELYPEYFEVSPSVNKSLKSIKSDLE